MTSKTVWEAEAGRSVSPIQGRTLYIYPTLKKGKREKEKRKEKKRENIRYKVGQINTSAHVVQHKSL